VSVAGLLHIDAVKSRAVVRNDGHGHVSKKASTTASGVTVAGHKATIDDRGISIDGQGPGGAILAGLNDALEQALAMLGVSSRIVGTQTSEEDTGLSVRAAGLRIAIDHEVKDLPTLQLPCLPIPELPCIAPPNPNGKYSATLLLGNAAVTNLASPA